MEYARLTGVLRSSAVARQQPEEMSNSPSPPGVPCRHAIGTALADSGGAMGTACGSMVCVMQNCTRTRARMMSQQGQSLTTAMVACCGWNAAAWA